MRRMEVLIGEVLRIGLFISVLIVFVGGILYLIQNGNHLIQYQVFQHNDAEVVLSFSYLWNQIANFSAQGIILVGFLILVLTQVLRVFLTTIMFLQTKDYFFTGISLFILGMLIYSLFWHK